MKKNVVLALLICLLPVFSMSACTRDHKGEPEEISVPEIPADYVYLASENLYLNYSSIGIAYIPLISGSPLTKDDVKVAVGSNPLDAERYGLGSNGGADIEVTMPFYVYQIYRGKDWAAYAALQLAAQDYKHAGYAEALAELEASQNEFLPDYLQLQEQGRLPVLYSYLLFLDFSDDPAYSEATDITLWVKDQKLTFPLGAVHYNANSERPDIGTGLVSRGEIAGWHVMFANSEGVFKETDGDSFCLHQASENITITDIGLWDDARSISDVQVVIENQHNATPAVDENGKPIPADIVADFLWDGKSPIELTEGQYIYFNFSFHDPNLANKPCGYTQYDFAVEYQDESGASFHVLNWYPMSVQTIAADPHELYLAHELNIDVMRYYTDFYYVLAESGGVTTIA